MLPNFIYVGASKSGSTWLQKFCEYHPDIFVPTSKDTYFFSHFYHRGLKWYKSHFKNCKNYRAIGEICHDYFVYEEALLRISKDCPGAKIILFARNPYDRAISSYKYLKRNGYKGDFLDAIAEYPIIIEEGFYHAALCRMQAIFPKRDILVVLFDVLRDDPESVAHQICKTLGVPFSSQAIPKESVNASLAPRNEALSRALWSAGKFVRYIGLGKVVGNIKSNKIIQKVIFTDWSASKLEKVESSIEFPIEVRVRYDQEIKEFGTCIGRDLGHWANYDKPFHDNTSEPPR